MVTLPSRPFNENCVSPLHTLLPTKDEIRKQYKKTEYAANLFPLNLVLGSFLLKKRDGQDV